MIQRYTFMAMLCATWLTGDIFTAATGPRRLGWVDWFKSKVARAPQSVAPQPVVDPIHQWLNKTPKAFDPIASVKIDDTLSSQQLTIQQKLHERRQAPLGLSVNSMDPRVSSLVPADPRESSLIIPSKAMQSWRSWFFSKIGKDYWPDLRGYVARLASLGIGRSATNVNLDRYKDIQESLHAPSMQVIKGNGHSCVKLIDVPVIQQTAKFNWPAGMIPATRLLWSKVASEEGGNCGYHALNNALWVAHALDQGFSWHVLDAQQQQKYFQFMTHAFPLIAEKRGAHQSANWLGGGELEDILKQLKGSLAVPVIIIEHVQADGLNFSEHVLQAIKKFVEGPDGLLGIVWNSGVRADLSSMGGSHWVSFVVQHNGDKINLYYMNSITGLHPNFSVIEKLLCNSPEQLQALIDQQAYDVMNRDIDLMKHKIKLVGGETRENVFKKYIGCIEYTGPFLTEFTHEQVAALDLSPAQVASVFASLNRNWTQYVKTKRPAALSFAAKRFYAVWVNVNLDANAFDVTVTSCLAATQKYHDSLLLIDGKDRVIIQPDTFFETMITICLVGWKDYAVWPDSVQWEIADLLVEYLSLAREHRSMVAPHNWSSFGGLHAAVSDLVSKLPAVVEQRSDFVASINDMMDQLSL